MANPRQELKRTNQQTRRRLIKRQLVALLVLLIFIIIGLIFFLRLDRWQLRDIVVRGNRVTSSADLTNAVESQLAGNYFYLLPRRQRWFYPERSIEDDLLEQFPRLQLAITSVRNGQLVLVVKEYSPAAVWCPGGPTPDAPIGASCYFVNDKAQAFSPAPQFSRPIYLTITTAKADLTLPSPASFSALDLSALLALQSQLQTLFDNYWPETVGIFLTRQLEAGDYSFTVLAKASNRSFEVMVNLERSLVDTLQTLEPLLSSDSLITKLADKNLSLEYLDLRFAPKVFYRFQD